MSNDFATPFQDLLEKYNGIYSDYDPFPDTSVDYFNSLDPVLKKDIYDEGLKYLGKPYSLIMATDFMRLVRCGDRSLYEEVYFERRIQLCSLVTAYLVSQDEKFLDDIINGIFIICEESSWVLPAHNTYVRDTPQLILPDKEHPVIDLFACETGALMSMIWYLLHDVLNGVSSFVEKRIRNEIYERVVMPYLDSHFWWMGNGNEKMCNWTAWCTQNVLLSVFLIPFDKEIRSRAVKQAAYSLDCFLKDYGEDGCCDEGAQYYHHAGLCLYGCLQILCDVTKGHFKSLALSEKIKNIASYIMYAHVDGKYYVNFSDCAARIDNMGIREFLFGKLCNLDSLMDISSADYKEALEDHTLLSEEFQQKNLYYRMLSIYYSGECLAHTQNKKNNANLIIPDIFYPSVGLMITRSDSFTLAAKAGCNDDNHNHNDTGSFTLYKCGKPIFVDIGVETYSRKTFSERRYEIWTMQSCYHNLPTINGHDQLPGREYCAGDVATILNENCKSMSMELSAAYGLADGTYNRKIELDTINNSVILSDKTSFDNVILNFITYDVPKNLSANKIEFSLGNAVISCEGASLEGIDTLAINDKRLQKSWDHDLTRIRLRMTSDEFIMTIR